MMIFGDKGLFAIELSYWLDKNQDILFANMCFWIDREKVGNYEENIVLTGTVIQEFITSLNNEGKRKAKYLNSKNKEEIAKIIYQDIYNVDVEKVSLEKIKKDKEFYQRFLLFPWIPETFDSWVIILLEDNSVERFIWFRTSKKDFLVKEVLLPRGTYQGVVNEFLEWSKLISSGLI